MKDIKNQGFLSRPPYLGGQKLTRRYLVLLGLGWRAKDSHSSAGHHWGEPVYYWEGKQEMGRQKDSRAGERSRVEEAKWLGIG